jgi:hypothetical protein
LVCTQRATVRPEQSLLPFLAVLSRFNSPMMSAQLVPELGLIKFYPPGPGWPDPWTPYDMAYGGVYSPGEFRPMISEQ